MADLRMEPSVTDSTEYVDDNGVTRQRIPQRRRASPGQETVSVRWVGAKRQKKRRLSLATDQGNHIDVVVPDPDAEQYEDDDDEGFGDMHTQGASYHFVKSEPQDVDSAHVDFLLNHYFHKIERVESSEDLEQRVGLEQRAGRERSGTKEDGTPSGAPAEVGSAPTTGRGPGRPPSPK